MKDRVKPHFYTQSLSVSRPMDTVNSDIFHVCEIKPSRNGEITLSFTDVGKLCLSLKFFKVASISFKAIHENKILPKISEFKTSLVYYPAV